MNTINEFKFLDKDNNVYIGWDEAQLEPLNLLFENYIPLPYLTNDIHGNKVFLSDIIRFKKSYGSVKSYIGRIEYREYQFVVHFIVRVYKSNRDLYIPFNMVKDIEFISNDTELDVNTFDD